MASTWLASVSLKRGEMSERVYICGETGDILLFDPVYFFDFFQVTAVEMVFMFQHMNASVPLFSYLGVIGGAAEVAPHAFVVYNCTIQDLYLKIYTYPHYSGI